MAHRLQVVKAHLYEIVSQYQQMDIDLKMAQVPELLKMKLGYPFSISEFGFSKFQHMIHYFGPEFECKMNAKNTLILCLGVAQNCSEQSGQSAFS